MTAVATSPRTARHATEPAVTGRNARRASPRSGHAGWEPDPGRPGPIDTLEAQAATRVQELLPIRYGRMLDSPFAFYRGAAAIMAADLAGTPTSGIRTQLCGDAHLSNFGTFAAPDRSLVFDLDDFDETFEGPWEWDLKRLVASFAVAGRDRGFDARERRRVARAATRAYREAMHEFAGMRAIDLWTLLLDVDKLLHRWQAEVDARRRESFERFAEQARRKDSLKAFSKLTRVVDGQPRFRSDPPALVPIDELLPEGHERDLEAELQSLLGDYRRSLEPHCRRLLDRYRPVDFARKMVGVGSVGTRAWVVLLLGPRRGRSIVPPVQGGEPLRARAARRHAAHTYSHAGAPGGRGPAADAGRGRHPPRAPEGRPRDGRGHPGLLRAPALGRQGIG